MNTLNWISVEQQLPKTSDQVLVTDGRQIAIANYFGLQTEDKCDAPHLVGKPWWANQHVQLIGRHINEITHWMPMSAIADTLQTIEKPKRNILFVSDDTQVCTMLAKILLHNVAPEVNVLTTMHPLAIMNKESWKDDQTNVEIWLANRRPKYFIEWTETIPGILQFDYVYVVTKETSDDYEKFSGHPEDGYKFHLVKNNHSYLDSPYQWAKLDLSNVLEVLDCPALRPIKTI